MNSLPTVIWITTTFVGFHQWLEAPPPVVYLRNLHRHVFHVRVRCVVKHDDRDIEFHMLKSKVDTIIASQLEPYLHEHPGMSCEMLAKYLAEKLIATGTQPCAVQVSEDGECGAEVYPRPRT